MDKMSTSFRLAHPAAQRLKDLERKTGSTRTAILEQAIAVYYRLLMTGQVAAPSKKDGRRTSTRAAETSEPVEQSTEESSEPWKVPYKIQGKPGRNDLCPCGSGRKFKHCHDRQDAVTL